MLHSGPTYKRVKDRIPNYIKRNNQTIRTLFQKLKDLLKIIPYACDTCLSSEYEEAELKPDKEWVGAFIVNQTNRVPPIEARPTKLEFMDFTRSGQTTISLFD